MFVTGTDTGVGKTLVACALVHALRARGLARRADEAGRGGRDAARGRLGQRGHAGARAGRGRPARASATAITPVLLREAMAPHIAAAPRGAPLVACAARRGAPAPGRGADFTVVEGVGGFLVPLGPQVDTVDLARALGLPVVLVVGLRLGCLNHALLTADAIERAGLRLAGWIANAIDPAMAAIDENVAALAERLRAPLIGRLPSRRRGSRATSPPPRRVDPPRMSAAVR